MNTVQIILLSLWGLGVTAFSLYAFYNIIKYDILGNKKYR